MRRRSEGFTLIELMIVVTIIAILATVAFPAYRNLVERSADNACLGEAKAYAQVVIAAIIGDDAIPAHSPGRCAAITTPASSDIAFTTTAAAPGSATITCDLANGGQCTL